MFSSVTHKNGGHSRQGKPIFQHLSALFLIVVFAADFLTPLGLAHGLLYLPVLVLACLGGDRKWLLALGMSALLFCSLGMVFASLPDNTSLTSVVFNRLLSLIAIVMVMVLCLERIDSRQRRAHTDSMLRFQQQIMRRWKTLLDEVGEQADVGYWWYDLSIGEMHWSEQINHLIGLAPGEGPTAEGILPYYPEPERKRLRKAFQQCLAEGTPYSEQLPMYTADGRELMVRTQGRLLCDEKGLAQEVVGTLYNLTPATLRAQALVENQNRLHQQLDTLPVIVWSAQADGAIDYFNQRLSDYSGVPREELSEPGLWMTLLHPDDQAACTRAWMAAVETGDPYSIRFRIRRFDGEYRWHQVQATPARDRDGRIVKWYGSAVEIPEAAVNADSSVSERPPED